MASIHLLSGISEPLHFIAVCGTAMASVAAELHRSGFAVTGSDAAFYPPMGDYLRSQGLKTFDGFAPAHLDGAGAVVVGNAVSRGNPELEAALDRNLPLTSLPDLIRSRYMAGRKSLVVAGTHGKTTLTAMLAHIFTSAGRDPGWLVGGMPLDRDEPCHNGGGDIFIIEGDEYDSAWFDKRPKFLHYRPFYAVLTSVEFDHSDIYPGFKDVAAAFRRFVGLMPRKGLFAVCGDDAGAMQAAEHCPAEVRRYGKGAHNHWRLTEAAVEQSVQRAEITIYGGAGYELVLAIPGEHNLMNALGAMTIADGIGIDPAVSIAALREFRGVARRLERVAEGGGLRLYDDFAHHPTAVAAGIKALRALHPGDQLWVLFEPRSNTSVRNYFQKEFTSALGRADGVILGPLHRGEQIPPDERLDREAIIKALNNRGKLAIAVSDADAAAGALIEHIEPPATAVIMTNGGFGGLKGKLLEYLNSKTM